MRPRPCAIVTGAAGFIGPSLCQRLRAEGWRVRALLRRPAMGPWDEMVLADLGRTPISPDTLLGVDCIFHLAGRAHTLAEGQEAEAAYRFANVQSTLDLLAAARAAGVRGFVYFSSVKAMGEGGPEPLDESAPACPTSPYGRSKRTAELAVLESGAVPHPVVVRPALVYGPEPKGYLRLLIKAVRAGWFPPLRATGNGRSMIHRDDLVEAAWRCALDPQARGRTYILTDGIPYSTRQIYEFILEALGRQAPAWNLPLPLLRTAAAGGDLIGRLRGRPFPFDSEVLDKLVGSARYEGGLIQRELGFVPRRTLRDSMREIVESIP